MVFTLEQHNPDTYRRKARIISFAMAGQLVIFGLLFAMLLTSTFGSSVWLYALAVVLGLLATSAMFAVLRDRPWMTEVRYVWLLKQYLTQISGYLPTLRRAMQEDNRVALDILAFYHQGIAQLAELNGRSAETGVERQAEQNQLQQKRAALGMPEQVSRFDSQDLHAFKRH